MDMTHTSRIVTPQGASRIAAALLVAAVFGFTLPRAPSPGQARSTGAPTPDSLAALFLDTFATGTIAQFDSVDPDSESRTVQHSAAQRKLPREAGVGRVVWKAPHRAVLLLTGTVRVGTGGDETNLVRHFSGFYEATDTGGSWTIARQIPIDTLNHIRGHALHVTLVPTRDARVIDTMDISVGVPYGFAARLNNAATLSRVTLDGAVPEYAFGGGVIWVRAPARSHSRLVLQYRIPRDQRTTPDTAAARDTAPVFGAFHNTDVWHTFFGYNSANSVGPASITVHIPAAYELATTVPQTESVSNGIRTVTGHTDYPAWLLSMIYDRDWKVVTSTVDGIRFQTFTTPSFKLSHDTLAAAFERIEKILGRRFGKIRPPYIAIVEDRALGSRSFSVRMTDAVITGSGATSLDRLGARGPAAPYAHEISHVMTMNASGPAANMLREGWATFSESVVLGAEYGPEVERDFWERLRNGYMLGSEGRLSILGNPDNGSVHYSKGSWIFHMLNNVLGDSVYDRGMRAYIQLQADAKPAGYEELIATMSHAAGRDLTSFTLPWFAEKVIPDVQAHVNGRTVVLTQAQPTAPFDLPLQLALTTASGRTFRRNFHLTRRVDSLTVAGSDSITAVHVDPDHQLLLQRHWGEIARFELPVAKAQGTDSVALVGDFSLSPVPAKRVGESWVVELPLTEGRYVWSWQIDGKPRAPGQGGDPGTQGDPALTGVRYVRPLQPIENGYPRPLEPITR